MQDGGQLDLLKQVVVVVGTDAVGAQGHVNALFQHFGHPGHAGGQLQVAHRIVGGGDALFRKDVHVLVGDPDAVGGGGANVKDAVFRQHGRGGLSVFCHAVFMLCPGLGEVNVHIQTVLPGEGGKVPPQGGKAGVLGVDGGVQLQPASVGIVPARQNFPVLLRHAVGVKAIAAFIKAHARIGEISVQSRVLHCPGHLGKVHIHIGEGHRSGGQHFGQGELRAQIDVVGGQFGLDGEHMVVEPLLQHIVIGIAPHQGHGGVGMGVDQAGHGDLAGAVQGAGGGLCGNTGADKGDAAVPYADAGVFQNAVIVVHGDHGKMVQKKIQHRLTPLPVRAGRPAPERRKPFPRGRQPR